MTRLRPRRLELRGSLTRRRGLRADGPPRRSRSRPTPTPRAAAGERRADEGRADAERRSRSPPSAGPPPHSPADSKTFVIEITVARTLESSTFAFSQVECTGAASDRVEPRGPEGRERERERAGEARTRAGRRPVARRTRSSVRAIRAGPIAAKRRDERLRDDDRRARRARRRGRRTRRSGRARRSRERRPRVGMRLPEPVEVLVRDAEEEADPGDQEQHRLTSDQGAALARRAHHRGERRDVLAPRRAEAGLRHHEREHGRERDEHRAARRRSAGAGRRARARQPPPIPSSAPIRAAAARWNERRSRRRPRP